ncbi:MAG: DUF87 domain-containing protein [Thermoplasmata archaeon]|nr:DUF87 domain-containing protein [Thermoplasmata archaeon]MCI4354029.1 DUF87 domain-containing protein [Thermoplasmata archaeon]
MAAPARRPRPEGAGWFARAGRVDAPLVLPQLPSEVPFGFLGRLVPTTLRAEVRLQIHRIPPDRALALLDRAQAVASAELASGASDDGARPVELEREAESAVEIARRVAAREQELWRVGLTVHALGANPARAEGARAELLRRFRAAGFRPRVPTFEAGPAAATPDLTGTERRPSGYWHTLHSDGVAAFFPFADESVTEPSGILVGLVVDEASPVFLDRWAHSSYSWGVFGATGSGKSFFAALTILRSLWMRPDLDVVVLDPLGEFAGLAELLGGRVLTVADDRDGRWNPLDPASTGGDRVEKAGRVGAILRALFPSLLDEEVAVLDAALRRLYDRGPNAPELSDLIEEVAAAPGGTGRLASLLEVFRSGSLRHLDGPTTLVWAPGLTVVSLVGVPEGHLPFHLAYLLDAVYARVRARPGPKLLVLDEAHLLARDPATGAFLDRLVRHLRHFETGVVVVSQNPDDFLGTEQGRSLLRNLRAAFLLRLSQVSDGAASFFQLTPAEVTWLPRARLPRETGYSEALLRFGPSHLPLALIASTPEVELLQRALGRRGEEPPAP